MACVTACGDKVPAGSKAKWDPLHDCIHAKCAATP
jgi:hypothetical protein